MGCPTINWCRELSPERGTFQGRLTKNGGFIENIRNSAESSIVPADGRYIGYEKRWGLRLIGLLAVSCVARSGRFACGWSPGSATDPLITLSYLNETFMGQIMDRVDQKIAQRNSGLGQSGAGMEFSVVTLSKGQVLTGDIGCEVMLRVGSATCVAASTPGLVDETSGSTLSGGGALAANHLYLNDCGEIRGVKAGADTVKLLVRGTYTIG